MDVRPDLSIIIPTYNCAALVGRAVESAFVFSDRALEVIVVDDGSTDVTKKVLAVLLSRFPALRVIRQDNGGLSSARNTGIQHAKGRYVVLLDADDELMPVGKFVSLDNCADVIRIGVEEVRMDGSTLQHVANPCQTTGQKYLAACFSNQRFYTPSWAYIYSLDWLRSKNLRFVNGLIHEDVLFTVEALLNCNSLAITDCLAYRYIRREESITAIANDARMLNRIKSLYTICARLTSHAKNHPNIDLGWWILFNIDYAASLARNNRLKSIRWVILRMEVRYFIFNQVWKPYRSRIETRYRLKRRFYEWLKW